MERETAIIIISEKIKLIRTVQGYSQDNMAEILGLSKKTLVQIEKERNTANWTTIVAICALFNHSEILNAVLGDDPVEFIKLIGLKNTEGKKEKTMGGKVWWKEVSKEGNFRLQQNIISQHYRILDEENYRRFSTFNLDDAINRLKELKEE